VKIFDSLKKSTKTTEHSEMPVRPHEREHKVSEPPNQTSIDILPHIAPQEEKTEQSVKPTDRESIDRQDLQKPIISQSRVVNKVPSQSQLADCLIAAHHPHSFEAEQFRMLRTNLLFPKSGQVSPRTLLVTSALPGEGKSFVSANLAVTIAQNVDKHVLLIDADMRRPSVHKLFGFGGVNGLSNYLNGGHSLPELLLRTPYPRLNILPGGPVPSNPAELLSSGRMAALLREVKNRYDDRYIIIDSPPPHLTSESTALAKFVDGIILVVKLGATPRELITKLIDNFEKGSVIGTVANWMEHGALSHYGSDNYAKHHYFGKPGSG
jgi:exopolysaccharide/PEP-CTERM locus tyrosine autokinase